MENIEEMIMKYERIGARDRARWLETIDEKIPPSFKERIKANDKTVTRELILPTWVDWNLLRNWALDDKSKVTCSACHEDTSKYIVYDNLIICKDCLSEIKKLKI